MISVSAKEVEFEVGIREATKWTSIGKLWRMCPAWFIRLVSSDHARLPSKGRGGHGEHEERKEREESEEAGEASQGGAKSSAPSQSRPHSQEKIDWGTNESERSEKAESVSASCSSTETAPRATFTATSGSYERFSGTEERRSSRPRAGQVSESALRKRRAQVGIELHKRGHPNQNGGRSE
jgi:hypothetical protein